MAVSGFSFHFSAFYLVELLVVFCLMGVGLSVLCLFLVLVAGPLMCLCWVSLFRIALVCFSLCKLAVFPYEVVVGLVKIWFPNSSLVLGCSMWDVLIWKVEIRMWGLGNRLLEVICVHTISSYGHSCSYGDRVSLCDVNINGGFVLGIGLRSGDLCGWGFEFTWVLVCQVVYEIN